VWWQADNEPANNHVGDHKPYRLQTVAEAIGDYFDSQEFKAKGKYGPLERHRIVIFQREYVGKETNYLLDSDLPADDVTQIEDEPGRPWFRSGFNLTLLKQYLAIPEVVETLGVASFDALKDILGGYAPSSHARRVLAHLRKGSRYSEASGAIEYDGYVRQIAEREREAARLVDLARRAYKKMSDECSVHNASATVDDFEGPLSFKDYHIARKPIVELAAHFGLISADNRHDAETQNCARELIEPLLYFSTAAEFLGVGYCLSQSGVNLYKDAAIVLLENYLGITEYKIEAAENVKELKAKQPQYREKRRSQSLNTVIKHIFNSFGLDESTKPLEVPHKIKTGASVFECICVCMFILMLMCVFSLKDVQTTIRKHASDRKARPNMVRFEADLELLMNGEKERRRALTRARKQRSRSNQAAKALDNLVNIGLGSSGNIQECAR
jgi:hypothetical protein